jgi:DNA mismatch repair protein MutS
VCAQIAGAAPRLLATARALAEIDVYASLAEVAVRYRYTRPQLNDGDEIRVIAGRHPVVELTLKDEPFVPNDVTMTKDAHIHIITGPNMSGKCVRGDTLVFTEHGLVPIESLKPGPMETETFAPTHYRVKGLDGYADASHFYVGGKRETVRIRTRLGYELEGTPEHRIWVRHSSGEEGWKPLGEIGQGDFVALDRQIDLWGNCEMLDTPRAANLGPRAAVKRYPLPNRLTTDLAYLMGLLIGDGTLRERNMLALTSGDDFIAREFYRIMNEQFGYRAQRLRKSRHFDFRVTSRQIRLYFEELGLGYVTALAKQIPPPILRAPKRIVAAFLQGLYDTDGYADLKGNVSLSTSSPELARQVQTLLLNFGIIAPLQTKKGVRSNNPNYILSTYGAEALTFYREIGFRLPRKQAGVKRVSTLRMPNVGGIPYLAPALKRLQARIVATPHKPVALKRIKSINSIFYTYLPSRRNISYFKLSELVDYCRHNDVPFPEIQTLAERRYFYDPVAKTTSGEAEVFDLSVEGAHSFVANGFVNHNSTFLRQTALIVLLAQIGSFVPAESAAIGLVDRIFTRIGAQDEIAAGQSTFMVEMVETANILAHSTRRSLIILDEIGRGTSTYDGIAIARAVVEHIHNHPRLGAKTLFATHYHELIELEEYLPKVRNYNVAVLEQPAGPAPSSGSVVFLHKIVRGGADKSYGIHVAQLAGIPKAVVHRAEEVLNELENRRAVDARRTDAAVQLALFSQNDPLREELAHLDVLSLSPLEALNKLFELVEQAKGGKDKPTGR